MGRNVSILVWNVYFYSVYATVILNVIWSTTTVNGHTKNSFYSYKYTWSTLNLNIWSCSGTLHFTCIWFLWCFLWICVCILCLCVCLTSESWVNGRYLSRLFDKHPITWTLPTAIRDISTSATTKVTIHPPPLSLSLSPIFTFSILSSFTLSSCASGFHSMNVTQCLSLCKIGLLGFITDVSFPDSKRSKLKIWSD